MIAKVIVDIPSKSVDFTFDYLVPSRMQSMIQIGMRVVVPFGPRTIQGYIMAITEQPDNDIDISKLKRNKGNPRYYARINTRVNRVDGLV